MNKKTLSLTLALAAVLRLLFIWRAPFWYDENFTLLISRLPFDQMMAATAGDVHPPLSYVIFWLVAQLGGPAWTLRIPSLIFSLGSVWLLSVWMRGVHKDPRSPLLGWALNTPICLRSAALFLMAIMPFQLWFAQEARMYAMLEFFFLLGVLSVYRRNWGLMLVSSIALVYLQNYGVFYVVTLWLLAAIRADDRYPLISEMIPPSLISGLTAAAWLPWALIVIKQAATISESYWIMAPTLGSTFDTLAKLFIMNTIPSEIVGLVYLVIFGGLALGLVVTIRARRWALLLLAFAPICFAWLASLIWQPILIARPLIGSAPFLYLIFVSPLEHLPQRQPTKRRASLYMAAFWVPVFLIGLLGFYIRTPSLKGGQQAEMIGALDYIRDNWQEGDVIYHTDDGSLVNWIPYSSELVHIKAPECGPVLGSLSSDTRSAMGIKIAALDAVPHSRAWIAAPISPLHPACYIAELGELLEDAQLKMIVNDSELLISGVYLK